MLVRSAKRLIYAWCTFARTTTPPTEGLRVAATARRDGARLGDTAYEHTERAPGSLVRARDSYA